jgi:hypothetical protein
MPEAIRAYEEYMDEPLKLFISLSSKVDFCQLNVSFIQFFTNYASFRLVAKLLKLWVYPSIEVNGI